VAYTLVFYRNGRHEARALRPPSARLGRDPANDIVVQDEGRSVSRFHARLDHDGRQWRIVDVNSTNRVRVNGELIEPGEAGARMLSDGDTVLLGGFELRFVREEAEAVVFEPEGRDAPSPARSHSSVSKPQDLSGFFEAPPSARLPQEAQDAIERARKALTVLSSVGQRIAAVTPVDDIIDAIVELVFEATPAERAALFLWDDEGSRLVPKRTRTRSGDGAVAMTVSETLVRQAFDDRAVVQLNPAAELSASMHRLRLRSAVAVPLVNESRTVGVIYADTSLHAAAFDAFGVALLSALASHAAIALEQTRLIRRARQEERNRAKLEQYLAPRVVSRILASGETSPGFKMKADEVDVTVLFCDMAGFTSRTEEMPPHEVLVLLNRCFSRMTEVIHEHEGTLDKYIGDCIMAVFGAPQPQPDHARRAALAALGLRDVIRSVNAEGAGVEVGFRIGIHSGRAVAGDVGHVTRRNWTVIGSTVNLASRMESSVARPGQIVVTGATQSRLGDGFELRPVKVARLPKGIKQRFQAFELLAFREPTTPLARPPEAEA
jgi:adenylate cyclase